MNEDAKNYPEVIQAEAAGTPSADLVPRGVILEIHPNGKISYISSGLKQITGFDRMQVLGSDVYAFLSKLMGAESSKQLWPFISEVLRGTREFLESNVQAIHPESAAKKVYALQFESNTEGSNRTILFLQDHSIERSFYNRLDRSELSSIRILREGKLVFLRADTSFRVIDALGDTNKILGIPAFELIRSPELWKELLSPESALSLDKVYDSLSRKPRRFNVEVKFHRYDNQKAVWMLFSIIPVYEDAKLIGWEGFGVDITDKKYTELELRRQTKRFNALYSIVSNIQRKQTAEQIALTALNELLSATNSLAGIVWYHDQDSDKFEILAIKGFDQQALDLLSTYQDQQGNLLSRVSANLESLIIEDLHKEAEELALSSLGPQYASLLMAPLQHDLAKEKSSFGAVMLLSDKKSQYQSDDLDLLNAAAKQVANSSKQANYLHAEKIQADAQSLLYRVSRRLTKAIKPEEVADSVFPLLVEQFDIKRIWMGVMNNGASHLVGVSGAGPGMRGSINQIQIELSLTHEFLDQAIKEREAIVMYRDDHPECSGLSRMMEFFDPAMLLIVPMVSIGQVVGVLVIEPNATSQSNIVHKIPLLCSAANEIATAIYSRRLESQIANADKMRMAGLLVSGVAHNFNNILQAVIGQASLIEAKLQGDDQLKKSARLIVDSANHGAELIKKMSLLTEPIMESAGDFDLVELLNNSVEEFRQLVGSEIELQVEIVPKKARVLGETAKVKEVVGSLLNNAREATERSTNEKTVYLRLLEKRVLSGEVAADLPPGDYYQIDIRDRGVGMDEQQQARCFEPFFTTKNFDEDTGVGYQGSGLSLANAYNVMQKHGGLIVVSSKLQQGTTFSIFFPAQERAFEELAKTKKATNRDIAVVIGSDISFPKETFDLLQSLDLKLLALAKRSEMLTYLATPSFHPKVLLVDLDSLNSDVVEFFKLLKERYPRLKILTIATESAAWNGVLRFIEDVVVLPKPVKLTKLHKSLKTFFAKDEGASLVERIERERLDTSKAIQGKVDEG